LETSYKTQRIQSIFKRFIFAYYLLFASLFILKAEHPYPFKDYEKINYTIKWLFISCGKASLEIKKISSTTYRIISTARSMPFFDNFYKVRDKTISIWDYKNNRSLFYEKYTEEGKHKDHELIEIDPKKNIAIFDKKDKWKITKNALDVLTSLYYVRTKDLNKEKNINFDVYTKRKLWKMKVILHGKKKVKINGKFYRVIVVEPVLREEGIFKAKGRIFVYLTDDNKRIPVMMVSEIPIGSIKAIMEEVRSEK